MLTINKKKRITQEKVKQNSFFLVYDHTSLVFPPLRKRRAIQKTRGSRANCDYFFMESAPINCPYKID